MTIGVDSIQVTVSSPVNCDRWLDEIEIATSEGDATDPLQLELQNEVKRLRNEANISEVELEEMSTDLINLQQQLQAANEFNTELQKKQLSTTTASKPNHSLRLRRSTSVSSRKPSLETVSELKEVDSLKAAIKKHKSNLERERLRSQSLSADGSALSVELEKTKKQLSNTREKNVILTDENNRLQKKMSGRWGDEHRNRYEEIISNERLARDRDKEFHSLEIEEEKTTQRELMLHNETLQSTVKLYKGNLQKLSTEFQDLQQSLAKRIDSRTENTSGIIQLKATLKLYEQSIETASTECSKLRERVEDQQQQLDNNDQTLQQLTSQAADKDNEIEHLRIRLNSCSCGANVQQTKHLSVDDKTNTSDKEIDQLRLILSLKEESEQDLRLENSSLLERFNSVSGKYNDLVSSQQKGGDEELLVKSNKEIDRLRLALSIREEAEESFRIENASLVERLNSVSKKKDINPSVSSEVARQLPAIPKLSGWKIPGVITYESGGRKSFTSEGDPFDITDAITTDHQKEITSLQEQLTTATRSIDMYKSKLSSTHRDLQTRDQQAGCLDKQLTAALIKVEESETNLRLLQTEDRNSEYRSEREVRELKQKLSDQDRLIDDSTKKSTAERIELEKKIAEISQQKSNAEYNLQLITEKMARSGKPRNDIRSRPPTGRPLQQEQQIVSNSSISRIDSSYEMNSSMGVGGGLLKSESLLSDLGYLRASPPPPPTRDPSVETQAGETSSVSRTLLQPSSQSVSPLLLPGMDVHSADGPAVLVERYSGSDQRLRSRDCWWARLPNGEEKLRAATELTPMSLKRSGDLNSETIIILSDDQSPDVLHVGRSETPPFASALDIIVNTSSPSFTMSKVQNQAAEYSGHSSSMCWSSGSEDQFSSTTGSISRGQSSLFSSKRRNRKGAEMSVVTTPWYPDGAVKEMVTLTDEIEALSRLMELSPKESSARHSIRSALQGEATRWWPDVTVKVYGSFAYVCSLPESGLDLVCEDCGDLRNFESSIYNIATNAHLTVEHIFSCAVGGENQSFCKFRDTQGVTANVTFFEGKSPARQTVSVVKRKLAQYPAIRDVYTTIRMVFRQSGCTDVGVGGLPSYAILLMLLHVAMKSQKPNDKGQLLVDFFTIFSVQQTIAISAQKVTDEKPANSQSALHVLDFDDQNNVTADCTKTAQVNAVCQACANTLAKWSLDGRFSGYRGRSPLSSILAYDTLWERAEQ